MWNSSTMWDMIAHDMGFHEGSPTTLSSEVQIILGTRLTTGHGGDSLIPLCVAALLQSMNIELLITTLELQSA